MTLSQRIQDARTKGTVWTEQQIAEAEDLAARMLDEPDRRNEILGALIRDSFKAEG